MWLTASLMTAHAVTLRGQCHLTGGLRLVACVDHATWLSQDVPVKMSPNTELLESCLQCHTCSQNVRM